MNKFWAEKIYTKSGFVQENILDGKKALDVGCGPRKLPGATGMDVRKLPGVDVEHDADIRPWPFADSTFDLVFFNQALEHLDSVPKALEEAYRVLKPEGRVLIQVPYFRSLDAYADSTHKHFFTSKTLDYIPNSKFIILKLWYGWPHKSSNPVREFFKKIAHKFPIFYDKYISIVIPVECLTWELERI